MSANQSKRNGFKYCLAGPAWAEESAGAKATATMVELTEAEYLSIVEARRVLGLTDEAMAAAGVDQATAEAIFADLRAWCAEHQSTLPAARANIAQARNALAETRRKINVGPPQSLMHG